MGFKQWLTETMTSTGDIAAFRRISIPMVRRQWPPAIATMFYNDPLEKKKKPKMQPQVKENVEHDPVQSILPELKFSFVRSGGPGGQNVNKINSKAVLKWDVYQSDFWQDPEIFGRFIELFKNRISKDNILVLTSTKTRDQLQNKQDCLNKLRAMIQRAMVAPVQRVPTKISSRKRAHQLDKKTLDKRAKQRRRGNKIL